MSTDIFLYVNCNYEIFKCKKELAWHEFKKEKKILYKVNIIIK